jgi:hypothetical protein
MRWNTGSIEGWDSSGVGNFTLNSVRGKQLRCTMVLLHQEPAYQVVCDADRLIFSRPMHAGAAWLLCQALNAMPADPDYFEVLPDEEYENAYVQFCARKCVEAGQERNRVVDELLSLGCPVDDVRSCRAVVSATAAVASAVAALVGSKVHRSSVIDRFVRAA